MSTMHWSDINTDSEHYTYDYFTQGNVCRLCWKENAQTELFDEIYDNANEVPLTEIIRDCLDVEVHNVLPNKLCENCYSEVKRFYSFKSFCRETDQKFQDIVHKGLAELNKVQVKVEVDDNYDRLENFLDIELKEETDKPLLTNSRLRKRDGPKRSPTYCNICCLDLKSKEVLSSHNDEVHGIENDGTSFRCFGCEKRFKSRKARLSHEADFCKMLKDGYKCSICDRYLPKRSTYECHMRDHRYNTLKELPECIFKCNKCSKRFKTKVLLKNHVLEHRAEKTYECNICGRVFSRPDYLQKHKFIHTGDKRHQCPHCDYKATLKSTLNTHMRKHTGERPYSCDICSQKCVSSSNLLVHRRRHFGGKKHELEEQTSSTDVPTESSPAAEEKEDDV